MIDNAVAFASVVSKLCFTCFTYIFSVSARQYLDQQIHPPTGGGPCVPPSPSVQLILTRLGDKPNMKGLPTGIDTECTYKCY